MTSCRPSPEVLAAFGVAEEPRPLPGGSATSWVAGRIVLKPGDGTLNRWLGEALPSLALEGVRVALPVAARSGQWSVAGWTATHHVEGDVPDLTAPQSWARVIAAGRRFHQAVAPLPRPAFLALRTDPWAVADRVAWGEQPMQFAPDLAPVASRLIRVPDPHGKPQIAHLDLTGNILLSPQLPPAVIDVSPYWRPATTAEGVVAADALCYHGGTGVDVQNLGVPVEAIAKALLFRLATLNVLWGTRPSLVDLPDQARRFEKAADAIGV